MTSLSALHIAFVRMGYFLTFFFINRMFCLLTPLLQDKIKNVGLYSGFFIKSLCNFDEKCYTDFNWVPMALFGWPETLLLFSAAHHRYGRLFIHRKEVL